MVAGFSHVALSVVDLERACAFYCGCFGFRPGDRYHGEGRRVSALMAVPGASFDGLFLKLDSFLLELLEYGSAPEATGAPLRAPEQPGLAHLSLLVDDVAATGDRVLAHGGVRQARMAHAFGGDSDTVIAFVLDPEGNRIELIEHRSRAGAVAHAEFIGARHLGWPGVLNAG